MIIYVKYMACESCKIFVRESLEELGIYQYRVELGEIITKEDVSDDDKKKLDLKLRTAGMQLLEKKSGVLIEKIRKFMIDYVDNPHDYNQDITFSKLLSQELGFNYTYLTRFFSEIEATTLNHYLIKLKIERVKELIIFGDDSFAEIAHQLNYSSAGHLSFQFKKITGLTPSQFMALREKRRTAMHKV